MNSVLCSYGNFSLFNWDEIQETKPNAAQTCIVRDYCSLLTLVTLFIKPIHIPLKCKHMQSKNFGCFFAKSKQFRQNCFIPVTQAGVFILENFLPGYKILGGNTEILVAGPVWLLICTHSQTNKFLRRKGKSGIVRSQELSPHGRQGSYEEK